jgi:xanthine dehydrogenase accessory factor
MSRMSLREVLSPLDSWSSQGKPAGLATLIRAQRSAPRRPGARFAATDAGDTAGSVSSGCIEGDLYEHVQQILGGGEPRRLIYGITDEMAAEVGLACGGEIEVFADRYVAGDPVWPALRHAVQHGLPTLLLTGVSGPVTGRRLLAPDGGEPVGTLGSAVIDRELVAKARPLLEAPGTMLLGVPSELLNGEESAAAEIFAEVLLPPPRLAIVGASPVASALCHLASFTGFEVTVIDPRQAFLAADKFPEAAHLLASWPDEGLAEMGLDRYTSVVVLAHDRKLDVPALEAALQVGCRYVGQIGGRRTQRLRREALAESGFEESVIERVRGPVGLDIGSETPEEIALAILAEIVAVRQGRV